MSPTATAERGFSLIELLIVVAIIGIIAGIAYPSYGEYVKRTRRSDAHLALLAAAQTMERCKSIRYSYVGCTVDADSDEGYYTLALSDLAASTFTLTATPAGVQANDSECPTITLDHLGRQGPAPAGGGDSACWN